MLIFLLFGLPALVSSACHPTCLACETSLIISCVTCYLHAHTQLVTPSLCVCDRGYFPSPDSRNCLGCHPNCNSCSGPEVNKCTGCPATAKLAGASPNVCVCISGWPNPSVRTCSSCDVTCVTCSGFGPNDCTSCPSLRSLAGPAPSSCVCISSYFPDPTPVHCSPCASSCLVCVGGTATDCISCKTNAELVGSGPNGCGCRPGFVGSPDARNCVACDASCLTCYGPGPSNCLACKVHAVLAGGVCACVSSTYPNAGSCVACSPLCLSCKSALASACMTCKTNAGLKAAAPGTCYCNPGFVGKPDVSNCVPCDPSCSTCSGLTPQSCLTCKSTATLSGPAPAICLCAPGYFPDPIPATCTQCHPSCSTCDSGLPTSCATCKANATKTYYNACVCNPGYYFDSLQCSLCDPSCPTCTSGSSSSCLTCFSNAQILGPRPGPCVCSVGFYGSPDARSCQPCRNTCRVCDNGNEYGCTGCFQGAGLVGGVAPSYCVCSPGYVGIPDASACQACSPECQTCTGLLQTECTACFTNAVLISTPPSQCLCDAGYFPDPGEWHCSKCSITCQSCTNGGLSGCSSCHSHSSLSTAAPSICVCDTFYFPDPDSSHCSPCANSCLTCSDPKPDSCLMCKENALLRSSAPSVCVCRLGFFFQSGACLPCSPLCLSCVNDSEAGCTSCLPNASILPPSPSVCECDPGFFPAPDSAHCKKCAKGCLRCSSLTQCWSCGDGLVMVNESCVQCPANCIACEPGLVCVQCASGKFRDISGSCRDCEYCGSPLVAEVVSPYDHMYSIRFNREVAEPLTMENLILTTQPQTEFNWTFTAESENLIRVTGGPWKNSTEFVLEIVGAVRDEFDTQLSTRFFELSPPLHAVIVPPQPVRNETDANNFTVPVSNVTMRTVTKTSSSVMMSSAVVSGASAGGAGLAVQLLSNMQYFSYIGYTDSSKPDDAKDFYVSLNQKFWMPNFFTKEISPFSRRLSSLDSDKDFLDTAGPFLSLLIITAGVHAGLQLFCLALHPERKWVYSFKTEFEWSLYFYLYTFAYLDVLVSSLLQLKIWTLSTIEPRAMLCTVGAAVIATVCVLTPFALLWVLLTRQSDLGSWKVLTNSMRCEGWSRLYYPVFFGQRLLYAIFIVVLMDNPTLQSILFLLPVFMMAAFVAFAQPLRSKVERVLQIIAEIDAVAVFALLCVLTVRGSVPGEFTTWLLVGLTVKSFICSVLILAVLAARVVWSWCQRVQTKRQVAPTMEIDTKVSTVAEDYNVSFGPDTHYPHLFHKVSEKTLSEARDSVSHYISGTNPGE